MTIHPPRFRRVKSVAGLLAVLALQAFVPLRADAPAFAWRRETNRAFGAGEKISYRIRYGMMTGGSVLMEVGGPQRLAGRLAYRIVSRASTNKMLDRVFKVRDLNESWMDAESLCSLGFVQSVREGGYYKETATAFDHPSGIFSYVFKDHPFDSRLGQPFPPFTQDILSSLYYARTREWTVGSEIIFDVNSGGRNWPLKLTVQGVETVQTPAGKFECWRVEPTLAGEGLFKSKGRLVVWFTRDERKVPVLLQSEVAVGAFQADMTEYVPGNPQG
ncbi:MAG TPA: DUF3108 domain-containing protein [Elusimicrobiota bacterium]|nr:DUF3108 domain-containing protein [Elusimicrobiota bacterium]